MKLETGNEMVHLHQRAEPLKAPGQPRIETGQIRLASAEAERLLAMLSGDLCAARSASARINAIKARLAAATEDHR
jgi:hypothetical protein